MISLVWIGLELLQFMSKIQFAERKPFLWRDLGRAGRIIYLVAIKQKNNILQLVT